MSDSTTKIVVYRSSKVLPIQSVRLVGLKSIKQHLRVQIATELPDSSCCVTYAYFLEAVNKLTLEVRRIAEVTELSNLDDLRITCLAQCITESQELT